jgi:hypothetical protein
MGVVALANYLPRFGSPSPALTEIERLAPEPALDLVAEAEARGRRAAAAEAEARTAELLAEERAAAELRLAEARRDWVAAAADRLAARIVEAFGQLETGIAAAMTRVLTPFLATAARRAAIEDLARTLEGLLADGEHRTLRISGPEDLLAAIEARVPPAAGAVAFVPDDSTDVTVVADKTIVTTQIGAWMDRLWKAESDGDA